MARIGSLYLAVVCGGLFTLSLGAQTPSDPPPPPPPGPEMDHPDHPFPDKKDGEGPGRKDKEPGMGRFGPGMGGPQFEKMVELALGSDADIQEALKKWPRIQDKEPEAQERFLKQIENFRKFLKTQALREAEQMGLKIKPEQEDAFVRDFWIKRLEVDRTLRQEMEPRKKELTDKMNEELKKQFGS